MKKTLPLKDNWRVLLLLLALTISRGWAQQFTTCPPVPPNTQRGQIIAPNPICPNTRITVQAPAAVTNAKYVFDFRRWSDTTTATTTNTYTYPRTGNYLIVQLGRVNGRPSYACLQVQVLDVTPPQFSLTSCGNATVVLTITNLAALRYNIYNINWGDGSGTATWIPGQPLPLKTYSTNNPVNIQVTGVHLLNMCSSPSIMQRFTPVGTAPNIPAWTKVEVIDQNTVEVSYQNTTGTSNFAIRQRVSTVANSTVVNATPTTSGSESKVRITGLNTTANIYVYTNSLNATCAGRPIVINSPEIATVSLQAINTQPYQNQLVWRPYTNRVNRYRILRDGQEIATVAANLSTYTDTRVECGKTYKYQVVAEYTGMPVATSASIIREATTQPVALPGPIPSVLATVQNNRATVSAVTIPTGVRITRYKITSDGIERSTTARTLIDTASRPQTRQYCYQMTYEDACGRTPTTVPPSVCTIFLENKGETLRWTSELPFTGQLRGYFVDKLNAQGAVVRTYNLNRDTDWLMDPDDPQQEVTYRVRAVSTTNLTSVSNTVTYLRPMKIFVPSAFTPNTDNQNESLPIKGQFITEAFLVIFDRWGNPVFETKDWQKGWNGTIEGGQKWAAGHYAYTIEATDTKGNKATQRGSVQVLK